MQVCAGPSSFYFECFYTREGGAAKKSRQQRKENRKIVLRDGIRNDPHRNSGDIMKIKEKGKAERRARERKYCKHRIQMLRLLSSNRT